MKDNEIKMKMREIFSNILDLPMEKINNDLNPKNTKKWDSLNHVKIIMAIENTFDIDILPEEAINLTSFKDTLELMKNRK